VRDLLVIAVVYAAIPVIVFRPFAGLLVYAWLAYMRPQDMAWGATKVMPLSQWVAVAMVLGIAFAMGRERLLTLKVQTLLLLLLIGWISITVATALVPEVSKVVYGHYWKGILIAVVTTGLVRDRRRLRILLMVIAFSLGFLGAKRGLYGLLRGGVRYDDGPGGFMADNNTFALMLNIALPLLVGLALTEKERILKVLAWVTAGLTLLTILFTFSRGGFLTLCLVVGMLLWRSRQRLAVGGAIALFLAAFLYFTPGSFTRQFVERTSSISDYEEDGSAQGRLAAWGTAWRAFLDYPVTGVGPNNLQIVHARYSTEPNRFRVTHNAYLQLLAECGLPALLLFLGVIGTALLRLQTLRAGDGDGDRDGWVEVWARMLQISILAFLAGSMFLSTAYTELIYQLIGLSVALEVVARTSAVDATAADVPWWKRPLPAAAWAKEA